MNRIDTLSVPQIETKPGDILIFEAGNDWIGKSIALITNSTVSHAAMVYGEKTIVEMGMDGINVNGFTAGEGRGAYLMRLKDPNLDTSRLLSTAKKYINAHIPYDFPALVILAGLLVYKRIRPTPKLLKVTDLIIHGACLALDKLINQMSKHRGKEVMVCSQLVYQIYLDAGKEYQMDIATWFSNNQMNSTKDKVLLAGLAEQNPFLSIDHLQSTQNELQMIDEEELAKQLYLALTDAKKDTHYDFSASNARNIDKTAAKSAEFLRLAEKLLSLSHLDIPLPALFITPADILNKSKNLEVLGTLNLKRI
jgi:hypothetical protein